MVRGRPVQLLVLRSLLHFLSFTVLHFTSLRRPFRDPRALRCFSSSLVHKSSQIDESLLLRRGTVDLAESSMARSTEASLLTPMIPPHTAQAAHSIDSPEGFQTTTSLDARRNALFLQCVVSRRTSQIDAGLSSDSTYIRFGRAGWLVPNLVELDGSKHFSLAPTFVYCRQSACSAVPEDIFGLGVVWRAFTGSRNNGLPVR
jgi:hypothetical protein